jgi:hypothetical protein
LPLLRFFTYSPNIKIIVSTDESDFPFIKKLVIISVFSRVNSWFDGFCNKVPKYASNVSSHILFTGDYFNNFIQFQTILACMEFIKGCVQCACKKPQRNVALLKPITSKYVMHRGQLDLVDKRADPDGGRP